MKYKDKVKINHPELEGIGIVTRFHNDEFNGVEVEIIEARRKSDGKEAVAGKRFNCFQEYLELLERSWSPGPIIVYDTFMEEIFEHGR